MVTLLSAGVGDRACVGRIDRLEESGNCVDEIPESDGAEVL